MRLLFLAGLFLTACAHETTQIDRELALKIVDKLPTVTIHQTAPQSAGPVNVYNTAATQPQQVMPIQAPVQQFGSNCVSTSVYDINGNLTGRMPVCYGDH